eukprot:5453936-Amphidinium_carterae.1
MSSSSFPGGACPMQWKISLVAFERFERVLVGQGFVPKVLNNYIARGVVWFGEQVKHLETTSWPNHSVIT